MDEQKINILVTGANGQLGSEIKAIDQKQNHYFFTNVSELDITDHLSIASFVKKYHIKIIVNCAAYTNVDKAQDEPEQADAINHKAVKAMAQVCAQHNVFLIHISTDYVFDGSGNIPYKETDETKPLGVYGQTKLDGEKAVEHSGIDYLIIRTSWLYSRFRHNFVKTIWRLSSEKEQLKVVFDQVGTPTNAADLARFIVDIIDNDKYKDKKGLYHFSNEGVCSWYDFAWEIVRQSQHQCKVNPCFSDEYPTKVVRPSFSVLDKTKLKSDFNYKIPYWKDSLQDFIKKINNKH